jgi:hypothetical protein
LIEKINTIGLEFSQILTQIKEAESQRSNAKAEYHKALDDGEEDRMSACLSTVRQSKQDIESLQSQLGLFSGRISELYAAQKELVTAARGELPKAESRVKKAQDDLKFAKGQIDKASYNILSSLNQLNDTINNNTRKAIT